MCRFSTCNRTEVKRGWMHTARLVLLFQALVVERLGRVVINLNCGYTVFHVKREGGDYLFPRRSNCLARFKDAKYLLLLHTPD